MDLVQLLLNPKPRSRKSSNAKPRTPKKTNSHHHLPRKTGRSQSNAPKPRTPKKSKSNSLKRKTKSTKTKTKRKKAQSNAHIPKKNKHKTLNIPKSHREKGKNLSNLSIVSDAEPMPTPAEIDPSAFAFDDDDDDAPNVSDPDPHAVHFSNLPWKMEEELRLKKEDSGHSSDQEKKKEMENKIWTNECNLSPRSSNEFVTIKPGVFRSKSLKTVYCDLKDPEEDGGLEQDMNLFEQIDTALGDYYKSFQRMDYFNVKGEGKFLLYCRERKLNDMEELDKYFGSETDIEPIECKYLDFDDQFPLNEYAPLPDEEEYDKEVMNKIEIYNVIEYCYHHKKAPN
eukprot:36766_1